MFETQLSDFQDFDYNSIIFYRPKPVVSSSSSSPPYEDPPEEEDPPGTDSTTDRPRGGLSSFQNCMKIRIAVKNRDGTIGDLIFSTPSSLYSFGIQEILDSEGEVTGYRMPISLWKKRTPTEEETAFQTVLQTIIDLSRECVEQHLQKSVDPKKFSPLSIPKETVEGDVKSPVLFTKLIYNKQEERILTVFMDDHNNEEISPQSILSKHCHVTGAIKIESIFIGDKITLQVKLYECLLRLARSPRKLLLKPNATLASTDKKREPS